MSETQRAREIALLELKTDALVKKYKEMAEHECDEDGSPDCDICGSCREHASFCSECNESNCCGTGGMSA